ncbi:hypothetical protein dqs_3867 [Azoarcus olearius]|nr:hypothetical protein dqs_3867 [Azoarcus olearius]
MPFHGTVANGSDFPGLEFMQRVESHPPQITDWMFIKYDFVVGRLTIQVIRSGMTAEDGATYNANAPCRFRN